MAKKDFYIQCRLRKPLGYGGFSYRVAWVPEKFAVEGKTLKLKIDGNWDNGWVVINSWQRMTREELNAYNRAHLIHRNNSDI